MSSYSLVSRGIAQYFRAALDGATIRLYRNHFRLADMTFHDGHSVTTRDRRLFSAIKDSSTSRKSFSPKAFPDSISRFPKKEANDKNIELYLTTDSQKRNDMADLVATADQLQFDDPEFREELSNWISKLSATAYDRSWRACWLAFLASCSY